jgi:hypothetical protein
MKKLKGFSVTWWITEIIRLTVFFASVVFMFFSSCLPFIISKDALIFEKIIYLIGLICIYIGLYCFYDEFIKCLRSFIRNNKKSQTGYSQEKIDCIKTQMENSVTHLFNHEED